MNKFAKNSLIAGVVIFCAALLWQATRKTDHDHTDHARAEDGDEHSQHSGAQHPRMRRNLSPGEALATGLPQGGFEHVFDKALNANRFLFAKGRDEKYRPNSDAASGMDLYFQDENGMDRLIHGSVTRARFSPDGSKIVFTTADGNMHVQELNGGQLAEVKGVYGASWKPDGSGVIFSKVGEGQDPLRPGTRNIFTLDVSTGRSQSLTDGHYDDGRPEYSPAGDRVLFVSGTRTGLASIWTVPAEGGEARQLTNVGLNEVNERFIPTPYDKTLWSSDQRWFVYDFKAGDRQETWGLEFNSDGSLKQASKLADGINPRWQDGRTLICDRITDKGIETVFGSLP